MKRFTLILFVVCLSLYSGQGFSQTYGFFAEKNIYNLDGNFFTDTTKVLGVIEQDLSTTYTSYWTVGPDSSYFGNKALRIKFTGQADDDRVKFRAVPMDPNLTDVEFSKFNDGEFIFFMKLLDPQGVSLCLQSYRPNKAGGVHESDELLSSHGLNTRLVNKWQKIYFNTNVMEGRVHDLSGFDYIGFRSRGYASNFILDEMYVDYRAMKTFGIFADSSKFKSEGSLGGSIQTEGGVTTEAVQSSSIPVGGYGNKGSGNALHVRFAGGNSDKVKFVGTSGASYPRWNDPLANLVLYIKLIDTLDIAIEYEALRNGQSINGSDEMLSAHGLDLKQTSNWQRIVLDLADGLSGDKFDFTQFQSFNLRSRGNASNFYVDEVYVRYPSSPTVGVVDGKASLPTSFVLSQNYPNPFNPTTQISFALAKGNYTTLRVYDLLGQQVAELINKELGPGYYQVSFDGSKLPSGTYFYRLKSGGNSEVKKMLLVR
jgi:hypothetical protein